MDFEHDPSDLNSPEVSTSVPGSRIRSFRVLAFMSTKDNANMGFVPWYAYTSGRREQEAYPTKTSTLLDISLFNISKENEY